MGSSLSTILLQESIIALDTNIFLYALEGNPDFPEATALFKKFPQTNCQLVTSAITLLEASVQLFRYREEHRIQDYLNFIRGHGRIKVLELTNSVALQAARLRAQWPKLMTPDAIQLATAQVAHATVFVSADRDIPAAKIGSVRVVQMLPKQ